MKVRVIGVDCATKPQKIGVAVADYDNGRCVNICVMPKRTKKSEVEDQIIESMGDGSNLLALDAPLGLCLPFNSSGL